MSTSIRIVAAAMVAVVSACNVQGAEPPVSPPPAAAATLERAGLGEFRSDAATVTVELDRLPAIGERAVAIITVAPNRRLERATITIDPGSKLELVALPAGFEPIDLPTRYQRGTHRGARGTVPIDGDRPLTLTLPVAAVDGGSALLDVAVVVPGERHAARGGVALTLDQLRSILGIRYDGPGGIHTLGGDSGLCTVVPGRGIDGSAVFHDTDGDAQPIRGAQVELHRFDDDALLDYTDTDSLGRFGFCGLDELLDNEDTQVYVKVLASAGYGKVTTPDGTTLQLTCGCTPLLEAGKVSHLGEMAAGQGESGKGDQNGGFIAFDVLRQAFAKLSTAGCWDVAGSQCQPMTIAWGAGQADQYIGMQDKIDLAYESPEYPDVVIHEIAHAFMNRLYDMTAQAPQFCDPHSLSEASTKACAWSEGFADWLPLYMSNHHELTDQDGVADLEAPGFAYEDDGLVWDNTDSVEGRVAGALLDLGDGTNEWPWDRYTISGNEGEVFFDVMEKSLPADFSQFAVALEERLGIDADEAAFTKIRSTYFANTIDYDFRDELPAMSEVKRPWPQVDHNFFLLATPGWNVIGLRSDDTRTLRLFADEELTQQLESTTTNDLASGLSGSEHKATFIAFRGPPIAPERYYLQVDNQPGDGDSDYFVSGAISQTVFPGSTSFIATAPFQSYTVKGLSPNQPVSVLVEPLDGAVLDVYLINWSAQAVAAPGAVLASTSVAADDRPYLRFVNDAPAGKAFGLVVHVRAGVGSYTIHIDQKAPMFSAGVEYPFDSEYARPYADQSMSISGATAIEYERHHWAGAPVWANIPWQSRTHHLFYDDHITGPSTGRLGLITPSMTTFWKDGGTTLPLAVQAMNAAGFTGSASKQHTFPLDWDKYYCAEVTTP